MRGVIITIILAVALAAGAAWYFELWQPTWENPLDISKVTQLGTAKTPPKKTEVNLGDRLYKPAKGHAATNNPVIPRATQAPDPIIVSGCRIKPVEKQIVSAPTSGMVIFVGRKVEKQGDMPDNVDSIEIDLGNGKQLIYYQKLEKNTFVKPGEVIAMLDPAIPMKELEKTKNQIVVAELDHRSSEKTYAEAKAQYERMLRLLSISGGSGAAAEEVAMKKLTMERQLYEMKSKKEAIAVAKNEKDKMEILLGKHRIRNMMKGVGVIKEVFKNRGEAVRELEPVMELQNIQMLRAEGMVEEQYLNLLDSLPQNNAPKVTIEPIYNQTAYRTLKGHRAEVTSVAFSRNSQTPWMLSASRDHTVRVWSLYHPTAFWFLPHSAPVEVVACSPRGSGGNWCLTGCDDGSIHLWDLSKLKPGVLRAPVSAIIWSQQQHHRSGGVSALAFSPDGRFFASGGEDRNIAIWEITTTTDKGKPTPIVQKKYTFDDSHRVGAAHEGPITALNFTPSAQLVSASRDKTLRVWDLHAEGAKLVQTILGRSGSVSNLGVSHNGRYMLYDKGSKLQLLSIPDGNMMSELSSPTTSSSFENLALFSPDASLMLTAGGIDGRLELWKTPADGGRGVELRQWITKGAAVTCAAFAPEAGLNPQTSFAVSGDKAGNVYLWKVPTGKEIAQHSIQIREPIIRERWLGSGNQVRIGVNVNNVFDAQHPDGRLKPGATVTVVIEP